MEDVNTRENWQFSLLLLQKSEYERSCKCQSELKHELLTLTDNKSQSSTILFIN